MDLSSIVSYWSYICQVLMLFNSEPPSFSVKPYNQKVTEGSTVQLTCMATGYPVPNLQWLKDGIPFKSGDNVHVTNNGVQLIIHGIRKSQFGLYECRASNLVGVESVAALIEIQVPPTIYHTNSPLTAFKGQEVSLICQSSGDPVPVLQWVNPAGVTKRTSHGHLISDDTLKITEVNEDEDTGDWTCKACNVLGCDTRTVKVIVQVPPQIHFTSSPQTVINRQPVTLICQSLGNPTPALQWIDPLGENIQQDFGHIISGDTLDIKYANEHKDAGDWTCKACNMLGCDLRTVKVIIQESNTNKYLPVVKDQQPGFNRRQTVKEDQPGFNRGQTVMDSAIGMMKSVWDSVTCWKITVRNDCKSSIKLTAFPEMNTQDIYVIIPPNRQIIFCKSVILYITINLMEGMRERKMLCQNQPFARSQTIFVTENGIYTD